MVGAEVSAVVVFTEEVLAVAGSTGEASAVALSMAVVVSVADVSAVVVSTAVTFAVVVLVDATSAITDSLMMSSSAASAFPGGGAIRTDITTITRTITMDTVDIHTAMDTVGTVTTVAAVMDIAEPVTDTATATDQGMSGVRGVVDNPATAL
jgi:hypothetical protein